MTTERSDEMTAEQAQEVARAWLVEHYKGCTCRELDIGFKGGILLLGHEAGCPRMAGWN